MSCFQCNHISGHASDCPRGHEEQESTIESHEARISELEDLVRRLSERVAALEEAKESADNYAYWSRMYE